MSPHANNDRKIGASQSIKTKHISLFVSEEKKYFTHSAQSGEYDKRYNLNSGHDMMRKRATLRFQFMQQGREDMTRQISQGRF